METLNNYIIEKLKINKGIKNIKLRDVSNCSFENVNKKLWFESSKEEKKYDKIIKDQKSKNDTWGLIHLKTISNIRELLIYWYLSITNGWLDGSLKFKEEIIKRNLFNEDELDSYLLSRYKRMSGFKETEKNMEEYLDANNIKYEKI